MSVKSFDSVIKFFERANLKSLEKEDFIGKLRLLGLKAGDILHVQANILLGPIVGVDSLGKYIDTIIDWIFEVLTEKGTLVVPTHTVDVGRHGNVFVLEESKPSTGLFPEQILRRPDSVRSLHPISSIAAIGKRKKELCQDLPPTNYGFDSPYDRMYRYSTKGLFLGLSALGPEATGFTFMNYLEARLNVPYQYNKIIDVEVYAAGKKVEKKFFGNFRYMNPEVQYGFNRRNNINGRLSASGKMRSCELGSTKGMHMVSLGDFMAAGLEIFKEDPYGFIETDPDFPKGKIPNA